MRRYHQEIAAFGAATLIATFVSGAAIAAESSVTANTCSIAAAGNASNNTLNCNFGLTPEQLKQLTEAAVRGATEPLVAQIRAVGKTLDITADAAKTLFKLVGEDPNVSEDKLADALTKVAIDYKRLQTQATTTAALTRENPVAQALVVQAKAEINDGHLAHAHELLRQTTQAQLAAAQAARNLREQAQAAEDAQMLGAASATATEGDVALTERHYTEAADLFGQAARYVPPGHADVRLSYMDRQADALQRQGDERGNNQALQRAIEIYREELPERMRDRVPLDWARTQMNLGNALETLGRREGGTEHLTEAITAYRAALEEQTRERVPLDWALTQNNLGAALATLSERESGTAHLEEAVAAYRAALEEKKSPATLLRCNITETSQ
jgi:tetratricopeptide (TPR) repeat protein